MQFSKKNKISIPNHSDTHNKSLDSFDNVYDLTEIDAFKYLRGEEIKIESSNIPKDGFVVLTYKNLALGWGKSKNGVIKNHYPKGLRNN